MTDLHKAAQQALEALEEYAPQHGRPDDMMVAITARRAARVQQENKMPITDDHGKALLPQYQIVEKTGNWVLLYDQMQAGEKVRHEFRIQNLRHDIALYPGITLSEALKRFHEKVGADHE